MKKSKKFCLEDRIIVYHSNIIGRIAITFACIGLTIMSIFALIMGWHNNIQEINWIVYMCGVLLFDVCIFSVFKTYILLDLRRGLLVAREFPGFRKKEFNIKDIEKIIISDGYPDKNKESFTIDIVGPIYTYQIHSWTVGRAGQPLTETRSMKRQRLEEFAKCCNNRINEYKAKQ